MKIKKRKAFISIDMAFCAAVVIIMALMVLPKVNDVIESTKRNTDMASISAIANVISQYKYEVGNYPPNLAVLVTKNGAYGPWLSNLPSSDIWGTTNTGINGTGGGNSPYCYAYTSNGFAVWSMGKNKTNNSGGGGTTLPTAFSGDDYGVLGK